MSMECVCLCCSLASVRVCSLCSSSAAPSEPGPATVTSRWLGEGWGLVGRKEARLLGQLSLECGSRQGRPQQTSALPCTMQSHHLPATLASGETVRLVLMAGR